MVPRKYLRVAARTAGLLLGTFCVVLLIDRFGDRLGPGFTTRFDRSLDGQKQKQRSGGEGIFAKSKGDGVVKPDESDRPLDPLPQAAGRKVLNGHSRSAEDGASRGGRRKRKSQKKKGGKGGALAAAAAAAGGGNVAGTTGDFQSMDVVVNNEQHIGGFLRPEDGDVYLPFKFVKKYFDVYGDVKSSGGNKRLVFSHSYGRPFSPPKTYKHHASGAFMNFGTFNVASRERVLYLDECNVPVSAQWDPKGFHFATQISQYGLQHYSAMVEPVRCECLKFSVCSC